MGFFSHKVNRDEIKSGDHIYAWRTLFIYSHHGIPITVYPFCVLSLFFTHF
ncbi:hypothetical protein HanRHA438_Chr03g0139781 [Helianthus annuus]|nr:hypothetical protein HanRHA438_Chr03g0139781 [Helianthus annuus]